MNGNLLLNDGDDSNDENDVGEGDAECAYVNDEEDDSHLDGIDLMMRFQLAIQRSGRLFQKATAANVIGTCNVHISDLPMEIILYILKWVVSAELDLRSLDLCSYVSKGFYICAKDHEIWRLVCLK